MILINSAQSEFFSLIKFDKLYIRDDLINLTQYDQSSTILTNQS